MLYWNSTSAYTQLHYIFTAALNVSVVAISIKTLTTIAEGEEKNKNTL